MADFTVDFLPAITCVFVVYPVRCTANRVLRGTSGLPLIGHFNGIALVRIGVAVMIKVTGNFFPTIRISQDIVADTQ